MRYLDLRSNLEKFEDISYQLIKKNWPTSQSHFHFFFICIEINFLYRHSSMMMY